MRASTLALVALLLASAARADVDGDGVEDAIDNCPYAANFGQQDAGGPLDPAPDGIGDVCQCGDVDDDGRPTVRDVTLYRRALQLRPPGLPAVEKCDVAPLAGACDAGDVARLRQALAGLAPGIEPLCAPALPPPGVCGNGVPEPPETCDGADLAGASCASLGYLGGTLTCSAVCTLDTSACQAPGQPGDACASASECDGGLACVDGVCCTSACAGACERCDLPATSGTCALLPAGADPDAECGAVSCASYYVGWSGDECRAAADAPAEAVSCDGAGACETAAQLCASQPSGATSLLCHDVCQDPNLATCAGETPGVCSDVNPGTQTCGVGACVRTMNQCQGGLPLTCVPGPPSAEACNDVDDDCDGTADNGAFADSSEPNGGCGAAAPLTGVGSDQTRTYSNLTLFAAGDADYYSIVLTETDSSCGCGLSTDEDYQVRVTLTVPSSAGSYELCLNTNTCGWPPSYCFEVAAGASLTVTQNLDGACGPGQTDTYTSYVRISGLDAPGFECRPYTLTYTFDAGLCF